MNATIMVIATAPAVSVPMISNSVKPSFNPLAELIYQAFGMNTHACMDITNLALALDIERSVGTRPFAHRYPPVSSH